MLSSRLRSDRILWEDLATILLLPILIYLSTYTWSYPLVRTISGFIYFLLAPGYSFLAAVFPRLGVLDFATRLGLSLSVSVGLTTIGGLILNYSPVGISTASVLCMVTVFVGLCSATALWRRWESRNEAGSLGSSEVFFLMRLILWALSLYLIFLSIFSVGGIVREQVGDHEASEGKNRLTEFSIVTLNPNGEANRGNYLTGEPILFTVGVTNREGEIGTYRVVVSGDEGKEQLYDVRLESGEQWEQVVVWVFNEEHDVAKVSFLLYKQGVIEPYRSLYAWVTIAPRH